MDLAFADSELDPEEFRRRVVRARRSGTPAWLWPEVAVCDWAQASANLARAVGGALAGARPTLASTNPLATSLACYTSGVGPLLGWWAQSGALATDLETAELLGRHLDHGRSRERRVSARAKAVLRELSDRQIPCVVLKGGHTAYRYFPVAGTRPSSDLDLLVPADRSAGAESALRALGMASAGRAARESTWIDRAEARAPRSLWLVHEGDPWSVDLHSSLDLAAAPGARVVKLDRGRPFETGERHPLDPSATVLSQPLLLLHLAVHASGGLHNLTLLRMVEIVLVARQDIATGALRWKDFVALAQDIGGAGAAYPALRMCELLAPGTIPREVLESCSRAAPPRTRAIVDKLEPATAHRVDRDSLAEHFMWVSGPGGWLRQLRSDLMPGTASLARWWAIYEARAYRLLRGRMSR